MVDIEANYREIRARLPEHVVVVAAAKTRTAEEVLAAIRAGVTVVGHNYVQDAEAMIQAIGAQAQWHLLGHLQKNKVKKAAPIFDAVETLDSWPLAELLDQRCGALGRVLPVLIEVNSAEEPNKTGVLPADLDDLVRRVAQLPSLRIQGLMTMGPAVDDPDGARPCFRTTKAAFDRLADARIPNVEMRYLSMGMSQSFEAAVAEGSNMVRIGTRLFGPRPARF